MKILRFILPQPLNQKMNQTIFALAGVDVSAVDGPKTVRNLLGSRWMVEGGSGRYAHTSPTSLIQLRQQIIPCGSQGLQFISLDQDIVQTVLLKFSSFYLNLGNTVFFMMKLPSVTQLDSVNFTPFSVKLSNTNPSKLFVGSRHSI